MNRKITNRSYSELMSFDTFEDRYEYLRLYGDVGMETFGSHRYLNQVLYNSPEWRRFRREVIIRDNGCDLVCEDRPLFDYIIIHHINPITIEDVVNRSPAIFDFENVVCVSDITHKAIHYGNSDILLGVMVERKPGDTCLWKR